MRKVAAAAAPRWQRGGVRSYPAFSTLPLTSCCSGVACSRSGRSARHFFSIRLLSFCAPATPLPTAGFHTDTPGAPRAAGHTKPPAAAARRRPVAQPADRSRHGSQRLHAPPCVSRPACRAERGLQCTCFVTMPPTPTLLQDWQRPAMHPSSPSARAGSTTTPATTPRLARGPAKTQGSSQGPCGSHQGSGSC